MAQSSSRAYCSVPLCKTKKKTQPYLSFHTFPSEEHIRSHWIKAIRQDKDTFAASRSTLICSLHFQEDDIYIDCHGRRLLKKGVIPSKFAWNNFIAPNPQPAYERASERPVVDVQDAASMETANSQESFTDDHEYVDPAQDNVTELSTPQGRSDLNNYSISALQPRVWDQREQTDPLPDDWEEIPMDDHDYCSSPQPTYLDIALKEKQKLKAEITALQRQIEEMVLRNKFGLQRFAASDEDIRFYTRFENYTHLMSFWSQIEPATGDIVRVTRAQSADDDYNPFLKCLQPIDEFFLLMVCISVGLVPEDLAHRFNIPQSVVIRIISTWANFLYMLLGAIGTWLDEETVQRNMPKVFSNFADTHLILGSVELRCQTPDSLRLYNEMLPGLKSYSTFKGLLGLAPHGPVMFVTPLIEGDISDRELLKQSGLIPLLQPSMAVMVDRSFQVEDLVPCKVHIPALRKMTPHGARLRAHINRVVGRVLDHELFSTVIPVSLAGCVSQLFVVTCLLVNYQNRRLDRRPESDW